MLPRCPDSSTSYSTDALWESTFPDRWACRRRTWPWAESKTNGVPDSICSRNLMPSWSPLKSQAQMSPCSGILPFHSWLHMCGVLFHQGWPETNVQSKSNRRHTDSKSQMASTAFAAVSVEFLPPTPITSFCPPPFYIKSSLLAQITRSLWPSLLSSSH